MRSFRFRTIPFIATVLLVALGVALGQWQDRRAAGKIAQGRMLAERSAGAPLQLDGKMLAPADAEFQKVQVRGQFLRDWPVFLDNRPHEGRAGFYLLMPLRIEGSATHVLVARGWLPRNSAVREQLPPFATPEGVVTVEGVARTGMGHVMQLGEAAAIRPQAIMQNVEPAQFAQASGLAVQPFFIEQTGPAQAGDTLVRAWPAPALGVEKHQGYAFQWYALATMAILFFVITGFKREPSKPE